MIDLTTTVKEIERKRSDYRFEHNMPEPIGEESRERAQVLRDVCAAILKDSLEHEKAISTNNESLLKTFWEIQEGELYHHFEYGSLEDFVRNEYANFSNLHYALQQVYAINKLLLPLYSYEIQPPKTDDGEIVTVEALIAAASDSTIARVAQVPEFREMTPEQQTQVVLDIFEGKSRDKIVSEIKASQPRPTMGIVGYQKSHDDLHDLSFTDLTYQQLVFIRSALGKHADIRLNGEADNNGTLD